MDEVMNSEEIVETVEPTIEDESYDVDENSKTSALPAVGLGLAIGAVAAVAIPKAAKGVRKLAGKAKEKLSAKVEDHKIKKEEKKANKYVELNGDED